MACNNHSVLRDNYGGKILSIKGIRGKSSSCNGPAKRTRKVGSLGPDRMATMKSVSAVSKTNSKGANVKLSCDKFRRGSGKNSVGTVDQAILERKIFTAVAKMPAEIETKLIENGWIGKIKVDDGYFRRDGKYLLPSELNIIFDTRTLGIMSLNPELNIRNNECTYLSPPIY